MVKKISIVALILLIGMNLTFGGLFDALFGGGKKDDGKKKQKVKLVYVEWACATASTHTMQAVLQEKMGYDVEVLPVSAAAMWKALETGDADAMTTAWLPVTHKDYLAGVKDSVEDLGPNFKGAKLGLVVPTYVELDSLNDLKGNADKFDGKIVGIDPGAGMMKTTEKFIEEAGISDEYTLLEGSGATMTAALGEAIDNNEWIVVTGWAPHWKFGRWDLKILEDPEQYFGAAETINTVVRKGLKEDMPEVYNVLDNFFWESGDIAEQMVWNTEDGSDPYENAVKWINENPDMVSKWME